MTAHESGWYEMKALYIARAEEAAKMYGLDFYYEQNGIWLTFVGDDNIGEHTPSVVSIKARGWKNASNEFIKAANEWSQKQGAQE